MAKTAKTANMEELMNQMIHNMNQMMDAYLAAEKTMTKSAKTESAKTKSTTKSAKKSAPKQPSQSTSGKKSTWTPREQYLTEKYGDLEMRRNYISVKKEVAAEMAAEAKATGNYWTRKEYKEELYRRVNERMGKANA